MNNRIREGGKAVKRNVGSRRGIALAESLVLAGVLGVLAVVALPRFQKALVKAMLVEVRTDFDTLKGAIAEYRLDNGKLPYMFDPQTGKTSCSACFSLRVLTTPTSYLSNLNIAWDPFARKGVYIGGLPGGAKGPRPDVECYLYFSYEYSTEKYEKSGRTWMATVRARSEDYHSAYSLVCWGPDYQQGAVEFIEIKQNWEKKRHWDKVYDPSNGLRSNGDVVTAGGEPRFQGYVF